MSAQCCRRKSMKFVGMKMIVAGLFARIVVMKFVHDLSVWRTGHFTGQSCPALKVSALLLGIHFTPAAGITNTPAAQAKALSLVSKISVSALLVLVQLQCSVCRILGQERRNCMYSNARHLQLMSATTKRPTLIGQVHLSRVGSVVAMKTLPTSPLEYLIQKTS